MLKYTGNFHHSSAHFNVSSTRKLMICLQHLQSNPQFLKADRNYASYLTFKPSIFQFNQADKIINLEVICYHQVLANLHFSFFPWQLCYL